MSEKRRKDGLQKRLSDISEQRRRQQDQVRREKRTQQAKRFRGVDDHEGQEQVYDASALLAVIAVFTREGAQTPAGREALQTLRCHLSRNDAPIAIAMVVGGGAVPHLIAALRTPFGDHSVLDDALWCLTNISTGSQEETRHVLQGAPELVQMLMLTAPSSSSLPEQACWVLGNIAADSDEFRETLVANRGLQPLLKLLESYMSSASSSPTQARTVAWALSNLTRGSTPAEPFVQSGAMPLLISLTVHPDAGLSHEIWWIFTFLSAKSNDAVNVMLQMGLMNAVATSILAVATENAITTLGDLADDSTAVPILRTLGNLTSGPIEWIDLLLQHQQILPSVVFLASSSSSGGSRKNMIAKEALWVLRNILGGSPLHRAAALNAGVLTPLFSALQSGIFDIQREAMLALRNACTDTSAVSAVLVNGGPAALAEIVEMLRCKDAELSLAGLQLIRAIALHSTETKPQVVEQCQALGICDVLEELQYGAVSEELRASANALVDELFEEREEEDVSVDSSTQRADSVFTPALAGLGRGRHLATPSWM